MTTGNKVSLAWSQVRGRFQTANHRETTPGRDLELKFRGLNPMLGKTKEEIIAAVGPPTSTALGTGYELLDWSTKTYHIAIKFDPKTSTVMSTSEDASSRPVEA